MKPETIICTSNQEVTDPSRISIEQYNMATSVVHNCLARLIGRTMTLVEGIGLPAKQEEAIKRSIKDNMKDTRHDIDAALFERLFPGDAAMMPPVAYTSHDDPIENA